MPTDELLDAAMDAFWQVVAKAHPNIETGDIDPLTLARFTTAARDAIDTWIRLNS